VPGGSGVAAARPESSHAGVTAFDRWLARRIMREAGNPPLRFALWDGQDAWLPEAESAGRIVVRDRGALWAIVRSPELGFGDCYSAGRIEIEGDLIDVLYRAYRAMEEKASSSFKKSILGRLPRAGKNTLGGSRKHIHHHYDLGNDFYRLWLDERMVYTCAYYENAEATLEEAQEAKMHHVCRKVRLEPGQRVVEAGCGWGSLAIHMAREYGVHARAFNISHEQILYARERAAALGLEGQVEFVEADYRTVEGEYDAFVSVGMLEHVGVDNYRTLGEVAARSLKPDGRGLIHSIGRNAPAPNNPWIERRIFPGSYPPSLREMMSIFEGNQFSIIDIENLRLHYAKTLMEWLERFDANVSTVRKWYDEAFVRAWRLYLGGCSAAFLSSSIQLFQVVFTHRCHNRIAHTREHIYRREANGADWSFG
jgi:cyclopropane-fatty-acyl-phospholipid synthase